MVALVHGDGFARGQACAYGRGARRVFAPLRAQVQAGIAQIAGLAVVAEKIHRHAMLVGQQQHVVQALELLVEALQATAGNVDQRLRFFLVGTQLAGRHDMRVAGVAGVEAVLVDTAAPAAEHGAVALLAVQRIAHAKGFEFLNVGAIALHWHGGSPANTGRFWASLRRLPMKSNPQHMLQRKSGNATGVAVLAAALAIGRAQANPQ